MKKIPWYNFIKTSLHFNGDYFSTTTKKLKSPSMKEALECPESAI